MSVDHFFKGNEMTKNATSQTAVKASTAIVELDKLAQACATFESTELARTNQILYGLLAQVYKQYSLVAADKKVLSDVVKALVVILKTRGQRVQNNTSALSLFVRYVFNSDRQRIFNYTRAIQAAKSSKVGADDFVAFVNAAGGIEECKAQVPASADQQLKQEKLAQAMPLVDEVLSKDNNSVSLAHFKVDADMVKDLAESGLAVMLGTCDKQGNIVVRSVVPAHNEGYIKWAKQKMASYLADKQQQSSTAQAQAQQQASVDQALEILAKVQAGTVTVGEIA